MKITSATFAPPFEGADPSVVLRIEVQGSDFQHRAAPIIALVGDVIVENICVSLGNDGFVGQLREFPKNGDSLKVGYLDTGLATTSVVYNSLVS